MSPAHRPGRIGGVTDPEPTPSPPPAAPPARPGRYQRSVPGLLGALLVTLLVIGTFVAFRALNRTNPETAVEPVDYLAAVLGAQREGFEPAYPPTLPPGWRATSASLGLGDGLTWDLGLLTADDRFAGVRQATDESLETLVAAAVDPDAQEGPAEPVPGALAAEWRTFSDAGGDHGFGAVVDGQAVLVYGSAPEEDLRRLLGSLTQAPLDAAS